jgi:hypothetical protein
MRLWNERRWSLGDMTLLQLVLWREKHPEGKEQLHLPLDWELSSKSKQLLSPVAIVQRGSQQITEA